MKAAGVEMKDRDAEITRIFQVIVFTGLGIGLVAWLCTGIVWMSVVLTGVGFLVPVFQLNRRARDRAARVARQLDQFCTEFILAVSGGQDPFTALREQAQKAPEPIGSEIRRIVGQSRSGDLIEAIAEFGERIDLDEARLFSIGLGLAFQEGARLKPVLESIQYSLRSRAEIAGLVRELGAQDQTQSLIMAGIPVVMLPLMRIVAPSLTQPLFHTPTGQIVVVIDLAWMLFGVRLTRSWFGSVPA